MTCKIYVEYNIIDFGRSNLRTYLINFCVLKVIYNLILRKLLILIITTQNNIINNIFSNLMFKIMYSIEIVLFQIIQS